ncbi:ABC transporter substrate-binding protein [Devosia sp.]|uniref:ABC transporter substrate-binding protein n=1 Tax=Devosia sp. TaxID=1871048 RepID=UPI002AFF4C78|nr:ABC transporter substrate-binding protein [Devosia sp.]
MSYFRKVQGVAAAALIGATSLFALTSATLAAPEELTIALSGDIPTLDPSKDTSPIGLKFRLNVFNALTELGREGEVIPQLAESWSTSEDQTEWTFKLRPNVKFHDGSVMTAADVVFSAEHVLADTTSPVRTFMRLVQKVEALDDLTVRFTLSQPHASFARQSKYLYIMSRAYYEAAGDTGFATKPVGSGPYRLTEWVKDDRMVLEAFPDYWGGEPAIKKGTFHPIPSDAARANALLSGEIDLSPSLPPSLMDMLRGSPELRVETAPGYRVTFLELDPTRTPFDNAKIREAVDIGIDRVAIADRLLRGTGKATGVIVPPSNIGYDATIPTPQFDPERAKQLIAESGYDGTPFMIDYPNNNYPMANEVAQAIASYLTEAGLKVQLNPMEFTAFFPNWVQNKLSPMYFFAYGSSQFTAESVLTTLYETGGSPAGHHTDPAIDTIMAAHRAERDPAKKQDLIHEALRVGNAGRQIVPLYEMLQVYGVKADIDYTPYPDEIVRLYTFE